MNAWTLFEVGINLFQSILFLLFLKSKIHIIRNNRLADVGVVLISTAFLSAYLFYSIPIPDTFGCLFFFVYSLWMSDDRWFTCALWIVLGEILIITTASLLTSFYLRAFSLPYEMILIPGHYRLFFVVFSNFTLFIEFFFFMRTKRNTSALNWSALFLFLGINLLVLSIGDMLFWFQMKNNIEWELPFLAADIALVLITILSMALLYIMTTLTERKYQSEIALNQARYLRDYQSTLTDMYTDMVARQHDFKQQIQTLEQLIEHSDSDTAKSYFNKYKTKMVNKDTTFITGNLAVDALLTAKALSCNHQQISFDFTPYPLNDLPISEVDFCAIVGNLLDNAIEGADRIIKTDEKRWIHLSFSRIWNMFYITCENSMRPSTIKRYQGKFLSSKTDKSSIHGFGIQNIISIVSSAQGMYSFETNQNVFTANITLPYQVQTKEMT